MSSSRTAADAPAAAPQNSRGRVILASLIGTSIEFYDFYAYATAAVLVFPSLFFVNEDPAVALLASFAVFGVAFIARPIGSIIFGHFGDRVGRKGTLVASLLTMGIATFLIGCLPTALTPGWEFLAPFLLVVMRFCQGLGLGGEWSGAALLATENAPAGKRAIYGTFPQLGAPIGFIVANVLFLVLASTQPGDWPHPIRVMLHPDGARSRMAFSLGPHAANVGGQVALSVVVDPGGPNERAVDALADDEPVRAGEVIRIRTTGGGGWGNPLERDPDLVVRDVVWRKVSPEAALAAYGIVLTGSLEDDSLGWDADATVAERAARPAASEAFFDRGPGYARLSGGASHAEVDLR